MCWWARRNESQKQAPGGSLGPPLAASAWPLPCTGGTVEPGAPVQATGCFLFQSKACGGACEPSRPEPQPCANLVSGVARWPLAWARLPCPEAQKLPVPTLGSGRRLQLVRGRAEVHVGSWSWLLTAAARGRSELPAERSVGPHSSFGFGLLLFVLKELPHTRKEEIKIAGAWGLLCLVSSQEAVCEQGQSPCIRTISTASVAFAEMPPHPRAPAALPLEEVTVQLCPLARSGGGRQHSLPRRQLRGLVQKAAPEPRGSAAGSPGRQVTGTHGGARVPGQSGGGPTPPEQEEARGAAWVALCCAGSPRPLRPPATPPTEPVQATAPPAGPWARPAWASSPAQSGGRPCREGSDSLSAAPAPNSIRIYEACSSCWTPGAVQEPAGAQE